MWKSTIVILVLATGIALWFRTSSVIDVPKLPETFWGPEENKGAPQNVRTFTLSIPDLVIDDLNARLANRRKVVPSLENAGWTYGINTTFLEDVIKYWRTTYNWNKRERLLNKYHQYMTNIQGLDIHFYHVKPEVPSDRPNLKVLPLLILHGWPGSVVEFQKIIALLTKPHPDRDFVFEVIAPSLPGYGFSQAAVRPGLGAAQMSVIFKNLMLRLGFNKFYVQGGDWGAIISSNLASLFPDNIIGVHTNMCVVPFMPGFLWIAIGSVFPSLVVDKEHYSKMYPLSYHMTRIIEESGYMHLQASKPDTAGAAVGASPEGLAAYILEKFSTWTNDEYKYRPDGGLLEKFTLDELLDNIMLYWVTNSITTSFRLYAENFNKTNMATRIDELPVNVPSACAVFPHELVYTPESIIRTRYTNLIQYNHLPHGGHFAAFEEPLLLANDIFEFVSKTEDIKKKADTKDTPNVPNLPEPFWGPEKNRGASKEIRPFLINVTSPIIDDLKDRLAKRRELVPPLENTAWTYGTSTTYLENILEYWRTKYNWSQRQALLNKHPQYTTNIQGLDIHFYYVKPHVPSDRNVKVLPLLILHGWPGSVVEFQKIIPMLTTPRPDRDFVFEVIAPSLPGFAFSQAPVRPGLGPVQATKPDTIGTAVAASPVGLAAYILEKFSTGTNAEYRFRTDGGLLEKHSIDELLDNIMLYWITNSMTTSARIYAENFNKTNRESGLENLPVNVPSACAAFPHEILYHPENLLQSRYTNLIQYNYLPRGGHFAAMEEPALLADDIFEFVSKTEDIRKKAGNKDIPNAGKKIKEPTKI
ncbi:hypothetical protein DMN91_005823 [Ooceraea biroi]|uniref:Epoxide hydrolase N-terminal domain-containing protein n=1 Tax=Ooceraea biroi TaxID=2015173 RepID=A0A3L8DLY6_OOCBI|nr:hypothetical protein DMN91_005823 [Ooceraea biroi]